MVYYFYSTIKNNIGNITIFFNADTDFTVLRIFEVTFFIPYHYDTGTGIRYAKTNFRHKIDFLYHLAYQSL